MLWISLYLYPINKYYFRIVVIHSGIHDLYTIAQS